MCDSHYTAGRGYDRGRSMSPPALRSLVIVAVLAGVLAGPARGHAACPALTPRPALSPADAARALATVGFAASPLDGRAPLEVRMLWWTYPVSDPVSFEIDIDGVSAGTRSAQQHRHVFTQPGRHTITGRVIDRTGRAVSTT